MAFSNEPAAFASARKPSHQKPTQGLHTVEIKRPRSRVDGWKIQHPSWDFGPFPGHFPLELLPWMLQI